jgi:hypothetical protein
MADPQWDAIEEWARSYIERTRDALEHQGPEFITGQHRGEIKALRAMLDHFTPQPGVQPDRTVQPPAVPLPAGPPGYGL